MFLADACWVAVATLQRQDPQAAFEPRHIMQLIETMRLTDYPRSSVYAHLHQHCVANIQPSSGRYRMFTRLSDGRLRLYRPRDYTHPKRRGKIAPDRAALPPEHRALLDWYEQTYAHNQQPVEDPVLAMRGLGKEIWEGVDPDEYVASLRRGWE
jgi:hypothetical protein